MGGERFGICKPEQKSAEEWKGKGEFGKEGQKTKDQTRAGGAEETGETLSKRHRCNAVLPTGTAGAPCRAPSLGLRPPRPGSSTWKIHTRP